MMCGNHHQFLRHKKSYSVKKIKKNSYVVLLAIDEVQINGRINCDLSAHTYE